MSTYNKNGQLKLNPDKIISKKRKLNPDKLRVESAYVYKLQNDVSENRLKSLNESLEKMRSGWQDKETMERTKKELSSVRESIDRYNSFLSFSGSENGNDRLNILSNAYGQILEDFDSYAGAYSAFDNAEDYSKAVAAQEEYYKKWGHLAEEADFEEYVKKGEIETADPDKYLRQFNMPSTDPVRWLTGTRDKDDTYTLVAKGFSDMTDEEKKIYSYLLGKKGAEYANEFLADIENNLDTRGGVRHAQKILDIENPLLRSAASVGSATARGALGAIVNPGKYFWSEEDTKAVNPADVAEQVVQENSDPVTRILANTGSNIGNMLPYMALGGAASALGAEYGMAANTAAKFGQTVGAAGLGSGAAGDAYQRGITQYGLSEDQARLYGASVGLSEAVLQEALGGISAFGGIDERKLIAKADMINNAALRVAAKLGIKIGAEEIEEISQNYLEPLFRKIISGEEYDAPTRKENIETAIVTALSTGALEGGSVVSNDIRETALQNARLDMRYSGQEEAFNIALTQAVGQERAAEMLEGKYLPTRKETEAALKMVQPDSGQTKTALNEYAKALAADEIQRNPDNVQLKKLQQELNGAGVSSRQIARVEESREKRWEKQDKKFSTLYEKEVIQEAAKNRLEDIMGESVAKSYDVSAISAAIAKQVVGEKLTAKEAAAIQNSKYGMRVASEMDPAHVGTGEYTNAWLDDLEPTRVYGGRIERPGTGSFLSVNADSEQGNGQNAQNPSKTGNSSVINIPVLPDTGEENMAAEMAGIPRDLDVSATGKDTITETGETIDIKEISSIKDGVMKLRLQNGEEIDSRDVSYASADQAMLYEAVVNMGANAASADALVKNYNPADGRTATVYAAGVDEAYRYGYYGIPKKEMSKDGFSAMLTRSQRKFAYNLGKSDRQYRVQDRQAKLDARTPGEKQKSNGKKGRVYFEEGVQATTERQKASAAALKKIAEAVGIDIYIFKSKEGEGGRRVGDNGWYDPTDNSIHIDLYAGMQGNDTMLFTASHELVHFIREWSPAKFKVLADFLFEEYGKKDISVDTLIKEQIEKAKEAGRDITYDTAYEEVVADSCETMLSDGKAVEKLEKLKTKDKELWKKIKGFITELAAKIRAVYEGLSPDSKEGRYVAQMKDTAQRLQELFVDALYDASESYGKSDVNKGGAKSDTKHSIRKEFADEIDAWDGKKDKTFYIGNTSEALQSIGVKQSDIIWRSRKIGIILKKHEGMTREVIKQVPYILENPVLVLQSQNSDSRLAIFGEVTDTNGAPVTAILELQPTNKGGQILDMSVIASAYGKDTNPAGFIINSDLVYMDPNKKRTKRWLQGLGLQLPSDTTAIGSIGSISYSDGKVKIESTPASQYMQFKSENAGENPEKKYSTRDYSYEALTAKPDMQVTTLSGKVPGNRADIIFEAKRNAAKIGKFNPKDGSVSVHVKDIDTDVVLGTPGLRHSLDRRLEINALVTLQAGEILQNSIRINEMNPEKAEADSSYALIGAAQNAKGEIYVVRSVVNKFKSELTSMDVLYAISAKTESDLKIKKENRAGAYPQWTAEAATITGSTISISELLDYVNTYFPDILPEEVLRHYGHAQRPDGKLGQSALYSMRDPRQAAELNETQEFLEAENKALQESVQDLKTLVALQKEVMRGEGIRNATLNAAAEVLKKKVHADGETQFLSIPLRRFFNEVAAGVYLEWEDVERGAQPVVDWLMRHIKTEDFAASPELLRQSLTMEVYDSYWRLATLRQTAAVEVQEDINQLKSKHMKSMKGLRQRQQERIDKLYADHKENMDDLREKNRKRMDKLKKDMQDKARESRQKGIESRSKTAMRAKIKRVASELNRLLLNGTKEKNVKQELQYIVASILDLVNMDTVSADRRVSEYNQKIAQETDPEKRAALIKSRNYIRDMGDRIGDRLQQFKAKYAELKKSEDSELAPLYDEVVETLADNVQKIVGDTSLRDMSLEQLRAVYDLFQATRAVIYNTNRVFKEKGEARIEELQKTIAGEIGIGTKEDELNLIKGAKQFVWDEHTPIYAFRHIGSDTLLTEIYEKLREGQGGSARDLAADHAFLDNTKEKYGWAEWDKTTKQAFASADNQSFSLNLLERMEIYNASMRPQGRKHLLEGGIVLEKEAIAARKILKRSKKVKTTYRLDEQIIDDICDTLTEEQKAFAHELQQYLSKVIGKRLNEVSMRLYGIEMYNEDTYWPIIAYRDWENMLNGKNGDNLQARSYSFTNMLQANASGPLAIGEVTDTWAEHVCDAATYHNLVLPLENFRKLIGPKNSPVRRALQAKYGTGPVQYLDKLYQDMNGGIRKARDSMVFLDKAIRKSKKGAVLASASVAIQQPSAIARAYTLINPIYFIPPKVEKMAFWKHKQRWEKLKRYAPEALIKEMGHFDMGMGRGTIDWLLADKPQGVPEKVAAFFLDGSYRDEVLAKMPGLEDEITWVQIFSAIENETKAKRKDLVPGSEEFLQYCGKRFSEVINLTQVLDSTLSRSGHMRNENPLAKMETAFMAENTVTANMLMDAAIQGKRAGIKKGIKILSRTAVSVVSSVFLNALRLSIITAARDDDEEKSYFEKYIGEVYANFLSGINPLSWVPIAKNIVSALDGYEIERLDMAVVSDVIRAALAMNSDSKSVGEKIIAFSGSVGNLFGLPLKNVVRDARAVWNVLQSFGSDNKTTSAGIEMAIDEATSKNRYTKAERIYTQYSAGETEEVTRMVEEMMQTGIDSGKTEDEARSAVRSSMTTLLKPTYLVAYIAKDEAEMKKIRYLMQETEAYGSVGDIIRSCKKWIKDLEDEERMGEVIEKVEKAGLYKPDTDVAAAYQKLLKNLKK